MIKLKMNHFVANKNDISATGFDVHWKIHHY